jgi:Ca-activated chloride channel family protein
MTVLYRFWNNIPKPLLFGLFAGSGCLIGAIAGEIFLNATKPPPPPPPPVHSVSLVIDTSGSMKGEKLQEVKSAAIQFIKSRNSSNSSNLSKDTISVVSFSDQGYVAAPQTDNLMTLEQPVNSLTANGGTAIHHGLETAIKELLPTTDGLRSILLFTDGQPDNTNLALSAGESAEKQNIRIVAVATNDADTELLTQITGDASLVFPTSVGRFEQAFQKAEKAIYQSDIVSINPTPVSQISTVNSVLRIGGWTAILGLGTGLALIISQNIYLHRRLLTSRQGVVGTLGSVVVGVFAGVTGQFIYIAVPSFIALDITSKILGWSILGSLLGGGMAFFVPNLKLGRAMLGGGIGGGVGVLGFWLAAGVFGDLTGRLLGAAILGFFIGLMIALVEELAREGWLIVHWGPKEKSAIGLGAQPVVLGSSDQAHIYLPQEQGFSDVTATICLQGGKIEFNNKMNGQQQILKNGSKLQIGNLTIEVKTAT